jgi:hypothetical protein
MRHPLATLESIASQKRLDTLLSVPSFMMKLGPGEVILSSPEPHHVYASAGAAFFASPTGALKSTSNII